MGRILAMIVLTAGLGAQAAGQEMTLSKQDPYALGEAYAKGGKLLPAIRFYNAFISNSTGDNRMQAAKTALTKNWQAYIDQLADAGCFPEATREWVAMRDSLAIAAATHVRTKLEAAYANAVKSSRFDLAMRIADSVAKLLPTDPPLASKEALERIRAGALSPMRLTGASERPPSGNA